MTRWIPMLLVVLLAGCSTDNPPPATPTFYTNLASPTARFDAIAARDMINALRRKEGLGPVSIAPELARVADAEAHAVAARAIRSGQVTPSANVAARVNEAGYPLGEINKNISAGYYTIAEAFSGWRASKPHRATMLMAEATDMGIAAIYAPRARYKVYWTLIMANRKQP